MNTLWSDIKQYDRWKLIYAYVVFYILLSLLIDSQIGKEVYKQYGHEVAQNLSQRLVRLTMVVYLPLVFPPTIIRFIYFRRGLKRGIELYLHILISTAITFFLHYSLTGFTTGSLEFLGALAVYAILSYGSTKTNTTRQDLRFIFTVISIIMLFLCPYMLNLAIPNNKFLTIPIWDVVMLCYALNSHQRKDSNTYYSSESNTNYQEARQESKHSDTYGDIPSSQQYKAFKLISLGLAAIGRKTVQPNPYLTQELEAQRHNAERPSLLKSNPELHGFVKQELTKQLSEGLSAKALIRRKEYMFAFSRAFYDEFQRTRNVESVLGFMFWRVLQDKHPELGSEELEIMKISGLSAIYQYCQTVMQTMKG